MATVDGKTSFKIDELVNGSIVAGVINSSGQLILTTRGGATINAGYVTKPVGSPWSAGATYSNGDIVGYAGALWKASADHSTPKPPAMFTSVWTRLYGRSFDGWSEKEPFFVGDTPSESWEFFWKTGTPTVSLTSTVGEFETGKQALKITAAATQTQRFYQKEENIVHGGEVIVATVRAKLVSASTGAKLQGLILQNDETDIPAPFATGVVSAFNSEGDRTLTTSWATYTFTFTAANAKPRSMINFVAAAAASGAVFLIDWVRITRKQPSALDAYPVGAIYMSVSATNPGTVFGGTWTAWGSGRFPVGVDGTTDFDTVEETGGAKTHDHGLDNATTGARLRVGVDTGMWALVKTLPSRVMTKSHTVASPTTISSATTSAIAIEGTSDAASSLPPYITCYMWKRTA